MQRVAAGELVVEPALVAELVDARLNDPLAELTAREREILALMASRTDRGIREALGSAR